MGDMRVITASERNVLHRADSGAMKFRMSVPLPGLGPAITFTAKNNPFKELYKIILGRQTKVLNLTQAEPEVTAFTLTNVDFHEFQGFWISWYGKKIRMGLQGEDKPLLVYSYSAEHEIGYAQFNAGRSHWAPVEWIIETSPVSLKSVPCKKFDDKLRWVHHNPDENLPEDAMIGGFENGPIYIARAYHNTALCPGKYLPSTKQAYVAWGHREHSKRDFEILCGFNAKWVKTKQNYIPVNAFIGGRAEMQNEPLYIGRAMCEGKLIVGKVHVRYMSCFLPYNGREVEMPTYEILVVPEDDIPQALPAAKPF